MAARSQELEALCAEMERRERTAVEVEANTFRLRCGSKLSVDAIAVVCLEGVYRTARATRLQGNRLNALMDEADGSSNCKRAGLRGAARSMGGLPAV